MCKYQFGEEKCSHPRNMALECVGESRCTLSDDPLVEDILEMETDTITKEEEEPSEQEGCPNTETGIYCKKYGYFHCAGEDNCDTRDEYVDHLMEHKEEIQNKDIEEKLKKD